ncbi:hypothetical protein ADUPG1_012409 [Aduncisulcus paluster]|uniref:Uncharacterized protein n=1 Tax=Aduncisulcus paluster TaxID=2918883 RepID=A0ABQ5K047_9EUKA|nr:hypothetical protein ADUPG1_012409 [Aduncisulcus paluster]
MVRDGPYTSPPRCQRGGTLFIYVPTKNYGKYIAVEAKRMRTIVRTQYGLPSNTQFTTHIESDGYDLSVSVTTKNECFPFPVTHMDPIQPHHVDHDDHHDDDEEPTKTLLVGIDPGRSVLFGISLMVWDVVSLELTPITRATTDYSNFLIPRPRWLIANDKTNSVFTDPKGDLWFNPLYHLPHDIMHIEVLRLGGYMCEFLNFLLSSSAKKHVSKICDVHKIPCELSARFQRLKESIENHSHRCQEELARANCVSELIVLISGISEVEKIQMHTEEMNGLERKRTLRKKKDETKEDEIGKNKRNKRHAGNRKKVLTLSLNRLNLPQLRTPNTEVLKELPPFDLYDYSRLPWLWAPLTWFVDGVSVSGVVRYLCVKCQLFNKNYNFKRKNSSVHEVAMIDELLVTNKDEIAADIVIEETQILQNGLFTAEYRVQNIVQESREIFVTLYKEMITTLTNREIHRQSSPPQAPEPDMLSRLALDPSYARSIPNNDDDSFPGLLLGWVLNRSLPLNMHKAFYHVSLSHPNLNLYSPYDVIRMRQRLKNVQEFRLGLLPVHYRKTSMCFQLW